MIRASIEVIANDAFLSLSEQTCAALRQISPATIDRMLKPERARMSLRGTGYTKARGGLWDMIPVRTFGEWQQVDPGHVQTATVGHDGGFGSADCAFSLCLTDVCLGWTERRALKNRAARWVIEALDQIIENMPFTLLHLHPDNGSEFINHNLKRYCDEHRIALTRSRPERKNDNCYVEQKNFDTIRKLVGYARYSSDEALRALNELYFVDGLLHNYFLPSQKLISKTRTGSRVQKRYDAPRSPTERLLEHPAIQVAKLPPQHPHRSFDPFVVDRRTPTSSSFALSHTVVRMRPIASHSVATQQRGCITPGKSGTKAELIKHLALLTSCRSAISPSHRRC